jgi:DNA-binding MarR family transcriptional regulator
MNEQRNQDAGFFEQLARIQWLMHRYRLQKHRMFGPMGDPHRGQGRVLSLLKLQPEISQKDLGYLLDMRPQSLGELLTKLERAGYITRTPSEADRRVLNIQLTEEGRKAADAKAEPDNDSIFDCLSPEEQANLGDYLDRIILALEQALDDPQQEPGFGFGWGFGRHGRPHHGFGGPPPGPGHHHHPCRRKFSDDGDPCCGKPGGRGTPPGCHW